MLGGRVRSLLLCLMSLLLTACASDPPTPRGNAQPGQSCEKTNDCAWGFSCMDAECRQTDPYRISLSWDVDTDFDLHVRTPNRRELYFDRDNEQAWLGGDDCAREDCSKGAGNQEHALLRRLDTFSDEDAGDTDAGESDAGMRTPTTYRYEYWVDNYGCTTAGDYTLRVVAIDDTVIAEHQGTLDARCVESEHYVVALRFE